MDPITGVGLAASVIQLLTFSIDAIKTCQEVYQKGSVSDYSNLDYATNHLAHRTNELQQSLQSSSIGSRTLTREEKDLVELARKCEDCAKTLQKELDKLQTQPRASTLKAVRLAARAIRKRSTIDKINQQLQAYRSTLETSLLSRLSQRFDLQELQNDESFANLDKSQRHIITCLANAQTSLIDLVVRESTQTRHCITAQFRRVEKLYIDDRRYEEIVNSLFYPDISSRQEQVDDQFEGVKNSYDWIFDDPRTHRLEGYDKHSSQRQERQWDDFVRWLKSGHGVYWINGKAGSGKSTLMNHICNHSRRLELLGEWCSNRRLLTPTFFFWNAGTRLQKSIDGLLRSLIYQMLKECRELVGCVGNEPLHTWTQSRLLAILLNLSKQSQIPVAICMFIDGLDEFEGQKDTVIKMIGELADQTHIKVCVSSRPLLAFEEAFSEKPRLKLQDLTFESMREYAEFKLSEPIQKYVSPIKYNQTQARTLVDRIVLRADGVFLWAILVIRDLYDGMRGMANLDELEQTLEILPSELECLFIHMLHRIEPAFRRDAAYFLQIAIFHNSTYSDRMDLCRLFFSYSQREATDHPARYEDVATSDLVTACHTLRIILLSHTAGLLELTPQKKAGRVYERSKDWDPVLFMNISFLHRTARDFLLQNVEATSFLARYGCREAYIRLSIARGGLTQVAHLRHGVSKCPYNEWPNPVYYPFLAILEQISKAEQILGVAQANLMHSLNFEALAWEYCEPVEDKDYLPISRAFFIDARCMTSIDQVGMAAYVGMTHYVCEQLELPIDSRFHALSFPNLRDYSRSKRTTATLAWSEFTESRKRSIAFKMRSSKYRQALNECLQWRTDSGINSQTKFPQQNSLLAETYMLCCCDRRSFDLARILLRAGADPMVQVELLWTGFGHICMAGSFWSEWLKYLHDLRLRYDNINRRSQRSIFYDQDAKWDITSTDIFDTTKALLANGADINYQLRNPCEFNIYPKSRDLKYESFYLTLTASAMFILEECFGTKSEFREFAVAIASLVERPTRRIKAIKLSGFLQTIPELNYEESNSRPSAEESDRLLLLIDKWKDTRRQGDLDALQAALEEVWRAHNPGVKLRERNGDSSDDDLTTSDDDEHDEDNDHEKGTSD